MRRPLPRAAAAGAIAAALLRLPPALAAEAALECGIFSAPAAGAEPSLQPSQRLPLRDGQVFGWRIKLAPTGVPLRVREAITLPAEPKTWGDPEPELKRRTSADGRTVQSEYRLEARAGYLSNAWAVSPGDPKGAWQMKVSVEGQPERSCRFDAQ